MASKKKRVAVIGAGMSGILSITALKEEGHEPVCFEKTENFGGTWCYRETSTDGVASIMSTTVINHSKEMGALSNFPPKKECSNYMRHKELYQYVNEYVKHHECERHIHFNTEVTHVKRAFDFEETGRWKVAVRNNITGKVTTDTYDGVLVCVGHINRPKFAKYPGQETFKGKIMHTHSLKEVSGFKGQNVVVVGIGCSGLDAAVEISSVANQVYLSTRSGAVVITRVGPNGYPMDYVLFRRYLTWALDVLPINLVSWYIETFYFDPKFDQRLFCVRPQHHVLSKDPILNDHIGSKLLSRSVIQKPDIDQFEEDGVIFQGESEVTEADVVIMATGYTWKFPFLEDGVLEMKDGMINLYKCMFPIQLKHSTLAFIGFIYPFGPGFPLAELQSRWAVSVFSGKSYLPSKKAMMQDVKRRHERNVKRYLPSERMSIRVDYVQYMDEIATEIGAKPNILKLFFTDINLCLRLLFGPCVSYQYRLQGPHSWSGARQAIMKCDERVVWPLCKSKQANRGFFQRFLEYLFNLIPTNMYFNY